MWESTRVMPGSIENWLSRWVEEGFFGKDTINTGKYISILMAGIVFYSHHPIVDVISYFYQFHLIRTRYDVSIRKIKNKFSTWLRKFLHSSIYYLPPNNITCPSNPCRKYRQQQLAYERRIRVGVERDKLIKRKAFQIFVLIFLVGFSNFLLGRLPPCRWRAIKFIQLLRI